MAPRPKRHHLGDRLISSDAKPEEAACDYAVAAFDRAATQADRTWGIDRLPELVSPETAAKYGSAIAKLNAALVAFDPAEVAARAGVCMRGLAAMDAEARAAGHTPTPSAFWHYEHEGRAMIIAQDVRDWPLIEAMHPGVQIHSLREVAVALAAHGQAVVSLDAHTRASLPPVTLLNEVLDDEIKF